MPLLKKMPTLKRRSITFCIRFSPYEMKLIENYINRQGKKKEGKSVFLRQTIINTVVAEKVL